MKLRGAVAVMYQIIIIQYVDYYSEILFLFLVVIASCSVIYQLLKIISFYN